MKPSLIERGDPYFVVSACVCAPGLEQHEPVALPTLHSISITPRPAVRGGSWHEGEVRRPCCMGLVALLNPRADPPKGAAGHTRGRR